MNVGAPRHEASRDESIARRRTPVVAALSALCALALLAALVPVASALPPDRAYEKVSPDDKNGNDIQNGFDKAAADGDTATLPHLRRLRSDPGRADRGPVLLRANADGLDGQQPEPAARSRSRSQRHPLPGLQRGRRHRHLQRAGHQRRRPHTRNEQHLARQRGRQLRSDHVRPAAGPAGRLPGQPDLRRRLRRRLAHRLRARHDPVASRHGRPDRSRRHLQRLRRQRHPAATGLGAPQRHRRTQRRRDRHHLPEQVQRGLRRRLADLLVEHLRLRSTGGLRAPQRHVDRARLRVTADHSGSQRRPGEGLPVRDPGRLGCVLHQQREADQQRPGGAVRPRPLPV